MNGTKDFSYTGSVTCAYLQKAGHYKLEVWGAQGGTATHSGVSKQGGYGGYSNGVVYSESSSSLYIVVGSSGQNSSNGTGDANTGYNGGGNGSNRGDSDAGGGGGATHISTYNCGELKNCSSYKSSILIVAGGGGGGLQYSSGTQHSGIGGNGGGNVAGSGQMVGQENSNNFWCFGTGGTQTSGGDLTVPSGSTNNVEKCRSEGNNWVQSSFGQGQRVGSYSTYKSAIAGGGGGLYGGGSGVYGGAGGGSGYISNSLLLSDKGMYQYSGGAGGCTSSTAAATKTTCTSSYGAHTANYANTGNGYARITYLGT